MRRKTKSPPRPPARQPQDRYQDRYQESSGRSPIMAALNATTMAILAGIFILGVGIGVAISSTANFTPENVASREFIDRSAPNAEICVQYGASAVTMDMRAFVTLSPFNVYISQPSMQPGCVLRNNNWAVLERNNLISPQQVRECKNRMNTFGFTGSIEGNGREPKIDCIYQNDSAKNLFLDQPGGGSAPPESQRF
jgi:hypothetical protein